MVYLDIYHHYRPLSLIYSQHSFVLHWMVLDCYKSDAFYAFLLHKFVYSSSIQTIDPIRPSGLVSLKSQNK